MTKYQKASLYNALLQLFSDGLRPGGRGLRPLYYNKADDTFAAEGKGTSVSVFVNQPTPADFGITPQDLDELIDDDTLQFNQEKLRPLALRVVTDKGNELLSLAIGETIAQ